VSFELRTKPDFFSGAPECCGKYKRSRNRLDTIANMSCRSHHLACVGCALLLSTLRCCCAASPAALATPAEEAGVRNCWRSYTAGAEEHPWRRLRLLTCMTGNLAGRGKTGLAFLHAEEAQSSAVVVPVSPIADSMVIKFWATSQTIAVYIIPAVFDAVFLFILL